MRKTAANRKSSNVVDHRIPPMQQRMGYNSTDQGRGAKRARPTKMDVLMGNVTKAVKKNFASPQVRAGNEYKAIKVRGAIQARKTQNQKNAMAATVASALSKFKKAK